MLFVKFYFFLRRKLFFSWYVRHCSWTTNCREASHLLHFPCFKFSVAFYGTKIHCRTEIALRPK